MSESKSSNVSSQPSAEMEGTKPIAVYYDGSGLANEILGRNLKYLAEEDAKSATIRAFIKKHKDTLAGMEWRFHVYDCEIQLSYGYYRGQRCGPKDIARLW